MAGSRSRGVSPVFVATHDEIQRRKQEENPRALPLWAEERLPRDDESRSRGRRCGQNERGSGRSSDQSYRRSDSPSPSRSLSSSSSYSENSFCDRYSENMRKRSKSRASTSARGRKNKRERRSRRKPSLSSASSSDDSSRGGRLKKRTPRNHREKRRGSSSLNEKSSSSSGRDKKKKRSRKHKRRRDGRASSSAGGRLCPGGADASYGAGENSQNGEQSSPMGSSLGTVSNITSSTATATVSKSAVTTSQATKGRCMVPMTRDEYEAQRSIIREVYDPESGRTRLVRGTGEIIERIVSREEHGRINRLATACDGRSFATSLAAKINARER